MGKIVAWVEGVGAKSVVLRVYIFEINVVFYIPFSVHPGTRQFFCQQVLSMTFPIFNKSEMYSFRKEI